MTKTTPSRWSRSLGLALGLLASALLLAAAFLPGSRGIPVWFALVPALLCARGLTLGRLLWLSWLAGYLHCLAAYYWVTIVSGVGGLLLPIYLGLYWPLFFVAVEFLARRSGVPRLLSAIILWPVLEWIRGTALTGLPWFFLGHSLYSWPALIQSADLGGVLVLSVVVMGVNALVAVALDSAASRNKRVLCVSCASALFALNLAYGAWRLGTIALEPGPTVACVQPNVPQSIKIDQTEKDAADIFRRLRSYTLSREARRADVIFWPETMMPGLVGVDDMTVAYGMEPSEILDEPALGRFLTPQKRAEVIRLSQGGADFFEALGKVCGSEALRSLEPYSLMCATAEFSGKPLVAGAIWARVDDKGWVTMTYNRVYQFGPDGSEVGYYDKVHLVPFGEFIPFRDSMPPIAGLFERLMPVRPLVYPGPDFKVLRIGPYAYGPAICFEDTFSYIGRRYRRIGADILVNVTNDGWFGGSFELEAHLANAVFRAVETRMAVIRAANTGVSAVIAPTGVITARLTDSRGLDREIEGVLVATVPLCRKSTVYVAAGEAWLLVLLAALGGFAIVRKRSLR